MQLRIIPATLLFSLSACLAFGDTFNLHSNLSPSVFGQPVTITTDNILVSSRFLPDVTFTDSGTVIGTGTVDGTSGIASVTVSTLSAGMHTIMACTIDVKFGGTICSNPLTQVVNKAQASIALTSAMSLSGPGQAVQLTATLTIKAPSTAPPSSLTGSVAFLDGTTQFGTATVVNGAATLSQPFPSGSHSLTAVYAGNANFGSSISPPLTQLVTIPTTLTLTSSPNPSIANQPFVVTASVSPANAAGTVTFFPQISSSVSAPVVNGVATAVVTLSTPGIFQMTAGFSSVNGAFGTSSSNTVPQIVSSANAAPTTLTLSSSIDPSTAGEAVWLIASISPSNAAGSVAFFDGATPIGNGNFSNGQAAALTSFSTAGSHSLTAQFAGNATFGGSISPALTQVVLGAGPGSYSIGNTAGASVFTVQGQSFTPSVMGNRGAGSPPASGAVTLLGMSFDFQSPATAPQKLYIYLAPPTLAQVNNNGQGSLATATDNGGGVYLFTNLVLDANTKYFAVLSTPASIFDNPGDSYAGGADLFGQPVAAPAAIAEGASGFDTGFSATFQISQTLPATITTLSASPGSATSTQTVALTATVLPSTATGKVTFMDGATPLGSANLAAGQATFNVSSLSLGNHSLTAVYAGDTRFAGSASAPFFESISQAPLTGTWTVSQSHIGSFSSGQPLAFFTVTVSNTQGSGPTSGEVGVTEFPPAGLNGFIILSGANWNCAALSCSRSDSLPVGGSYPPITVAVTLAAGSATSISNFVAVGGGGLIQATSTDTASITPAFTDVLTTDSFLPAIDLLRESGITTGCTPTTYCGDAGITQAQMAVFIVRSVIGSDNFTFTPTPFFSDVPSSQPFFKWIQKMQDLGIALNCGANLFCPDSPVTRNQMAILIIRARYGLALPPNVPSTAFFTDVPNTDPAFSFVQKMAQVGITTGCSATLYCGASPVTRGQMAVFIMRGMFNLVPSAPNNPPLLSLSQSTIVQGAPATITIQAQNSHFAAGGTQVSAGPGITVSNVNVVNATTLTAQFAAATAASLGPRSVLAITGSEEATLPNVLLVSAHP